MYKRILLHIIHKEAAEALTTDRWIVDGMHVAESLAKEGQGAITPCSESAASEPGRLSQGREVLALQE